MRTTIEIDDALMREALKLSGLKTKREVVEAGLRLLVQLNRQKNVKPLRGQLRWQGSQHEMQ